METKGGGYVVVHIRAKMFYSGQSLSDGKDQSLSAKERNSVTTFLNSLSHAWFREVYNVHNSIIEFFGCLFA